MINHICFSCGNLDCEKVDTVEQYFTIVDCERYILDLQKKEKYDLCVECNEKNNCNYLNEKKHATV